MDQGTELLNQQQDSLDEAGVNDQSTKRMTVKQRKFMKLLNPLFNRNIRV